MDKKLFGSLALVLLLGAGCATTGTVDTSADANGSNTDTTSDITADDSSASGTVQAGTDVDLNGDLIGGDAVANLDGDVKEFTIEGGNFKFTPSTMTVKKGDTVRVTFKNDEGFHDFKLDEFGVATKQIGAGSEETVEFVADKVGSFEYYCSVGQHRQMGMKGTLTVTE